MMEKSGKKISKKQHLYRIFFISAIAITTAYFNGYGKNLLLEMKKNMCDGSINRIISYVLKEDTSCMSSDVANDLMSYPLSLLYRGQNQALRTTAGDVNNCNDLENVISADAKGVDNTQKYIMETYVSFCTVLKGISKGVSPFVHISDTFSMNKPEYLTVEVIPAISLQERQSILRDAENSQNLGTYLQEGIITLINSTANTLSFKYKGRFVYLNELGRSDFNNDGFEDVMIDILSYSEKGAFRVHKIAIISQRKQTQTLLDYTSYDYSCSHEGTQYKCYILSPPLGLIFYPMKIDSNPFINNNFINVENNIR